MLKYLLIPVHEIHGTLMVIVVMSTFGSINRELKIVWSETVPVSIRVGKDATLKHPIIRVVDARNHMGRVKRKLFILCKEVVDVPVQHQPPNWNQRQNVLRPDFGRVKWVKVKLVLIIRIHYLEVKLPLRKVAGCNGVVEIFGGMAVIGSSDPNRLFLQQILNPASGSPVKLHIMYFSGLVDQGIGLNA
jgi:hypothetical protein